MICEKKKQFCFTVPLCKFVSVCFNFMGTKQTKLPCCYYSVSSTMIDIKVPAYWDKFVARAAHRSAVSTLDNQSKAAGHDENVNF